MSSMIVTCQQERSSASKIRARNHMGFGPNIGVILHTDSVHGYVCVVVSGMYIDHAWHTRSPRQRQPSGEAQKSVCSLGGLAAVRDLEVRAL